ncbi:hypothetical protein [Pseudanabaena sp. UWO310]|uniref:hypothetical protein n=1 Tax=Pseudanabaena sp. UWO310 TaxID=2480795 RepID=UPI00115B582E|nr:hypothetical protein [Pseudanabaena sp. UWO310]TYQ31976.1 hypothetical protein PseudUWO310_00360 [Pseudanabaena sp. UWO310]
MTTPLKQALTAASALPQTEQDKIAELIFREIERLQKDETPKKPFMLKPVTKGSGYIDTSINHDAVLAEFIYTNKVSQQSR